MSQIETPQPTEQTVNELQADPALSTRRPRKVYQGMWGPIEIAAVSLGAICLLGAVVLYFLFVVPSDREVVKNRAEADRLEAEQKTMNSKYGEITSTKEQIQKLVSSADTFESNYLPIESTGRTDLYQRLNGLIAGYGLVNTTGPDYQPLETIDKTSNNQSEAERGRERFRSLFPGVYVTMTVEGTYQNLRRFIRDLETSNEFVIVSSVELAPSDTEQKPDLTKPPLQQQNAAAQQPPMGIGPNPIGGSKFIPADPNVPSAVSETAAPGGQSRKGKVHGEIVSLRLEMAAYFRRAAQPAATSEVTQ